MTVRIAINGFGRIGRSIVRALYESGRYLEIKVIAINELADAYSMAYLLKYDTVHREFAWNVYQECEQLFIGDNSVYLFHEKLIEMLPWRELNIDIVLDCTGIHGERKHGEEHIKSGAKKVLFSHLGADDLDTTIVYGINHQNLCSEHCIISNATCTTNCITPIIKLLDDAYEIESGTIMIIHSAMHDQQVIDTYHQNMRLSRAASQSIIPLNTQITSGIARIFPKFSNCFEATAVRVPTINVTAIDLNVLVKKSTKSSEINLLLQRATQNEFFGIVDYTELPLVSVDFNHNPHSAIIDGAQTRVGGKYLIKVFAWCDNEWGFANRMIDTISFMATHDFIR